MISFDLYSRRGCHLCELMIEAVLPIIGGKATLQVHDIDTRTDWREKYDVEVPVLEFAGERICRFRLDDTSVSNIQSRIDANSR